MRKRSQARSSLSSGKKIINIPPPLGELITVREETDLGEGVKRIIISVPLRYPGLNDDEMALLRRGMMMVRTAFTSAKARLSED